MRIRMHGRIETKTVFFGAEIVSHLPKPIHTCSTPQWQPGMVSRKYPRTGPDYPRKAAVCH
jgi:hypothetical protein